MQTPDDSDDTADATHLAPLNDEARLRFEALCRRYRESVFRLLHARIDNEDDAAELAQEALLRVMRYRDCNARSLRGLLMRTALNLAASHRLLARVQWTHVPLDGLQLVSDAPALDEQLDREQRRQQVMAAIKALPPRRRDILLLRVVSELSHREIAQRCGISQTAVEKHLARAQAAIRARVG